MTAPTITETPAGLLRRISALQKAGASVEIVVGPDPTPRERRARASREHRSDTVLNQYWIDRAEQAITEWKAARR